MGIERKPARNMSVIIDRLKELKIHGNSVIVNVGHPRTRFVVSQIRGLFRLEATGEIHDYDIDDNSAELKLEGFAYVPTNVFAWLKVLTNLWIVCILLFVGFNIGPTWDAMTPAIQYHRRPCINPQTGREYSHPQPVSCVSNMQRTVTEEASFSRLLFFIGGIVCLCIAAYATAKYDPYHNQYAKADNYLKEHLNDVLLHIDDNMKPIR